jgi:uncharacterized protein with PQ loop repeat
MLALGKGRHRPARACAACRPAERYACGSLPMSITQTIGILPAIVFPLATLAQIIRTLKQRSAAEVSVSAWLLFGFANLAIYIYAERYTEWQAIAGMLLTAISIS